MTKLMRYQQVGSALLEKYECRALLADEMGLGKTIQVLDAAKNFGIKRMIVVCPAGLKYHWQAEAAKHFKMRSDIVSTMSPPRKLMLPARIIIVNYDILRAWWKTLKRTNPDLIILDEAQYIKSPSAQRTRAVRKLCKGVKHIIPMSGTPLTNRPAELFVVLNLLWPEEFPSEMPFYRRYCNPRFRRGRWEFKGAKRLPELHRRIKSLGMVRRLKKDVLKELPAKKTVVRTVDIIRRKEYDEAENNFVSWMQKNFKSRANRAVSTERMVQTGYLKRLAAELKLPAMTEWIDQFLEGSDGKLIAFGLHKKILGPLFERYNKHRGFSVLVDGSVTGHKRHLAFEQFQKSSKCRIIFAQFYAAGTGWNGSVSQDVVGLELPWEPATLVQAFDRPHRIGQLGSVTGTCLVAENTIETDLCEILQRKQRIISDVLDGEGKGNELPLVDEIYSRMRKRRS